SAEKAFERVAGDKNRPLLQTSNPMQKIVELLNQREAHYRKADFIRDTSTSSIEEVVRDILRNFPQD
ncbi:MAG: shikimate kinase, partial [Verrucomicrobiota bacterium]|nr:shikimate kinase [Verrucomicrobiota bacterium]